MGANIGQFAQQLRQFGYCNRIVSFEPVRDSFELLKTQAEADPFWETTSLALGAYSHRARINISRNSVSSSIRDLETKTLIAEPTVEYINSECISVESLDTVFSRFVSPTDKVFLKVDVQGYENEVFQGALQSLHRVEGLVLECSLSSLYKGEWELLDALEFFNSKNFVLWDMERVFSDRRTRKLLQVDAVFWNANNETPISIPTGEAK